MAKISTFILLNKMFLNASERNNEVISFIPIPVILEFIELIVSICVLNIVCTKLGGSTIYQIVNETKNPINKYNKKSIAFQCSLSNAGAIFILTWNASVISAAVG